MTDYSQTFGSAPTTTRNGGSVKDKTTDVAQTGKQAVGEVAQTATTAVKDVADESRRQASDLVGKTRDQLSEQVSTQQTSVVENLRSLANQLAAMTDDVQQDGTAIDAAARARDKARGAADWLDAREPGEVLDEIRKFGRERPGVFLLGAAVAGVVAGRLTRGVVAVHADDAAGEGAPAAALPTHQTSYQPGGTAAP